MATDIPISCALLFLRPQQGAHYSIERSFEAIWAHLEQARDIRCVRVIAKRPSQGLRNRMLILAQMLRLRAGVYHVTGDIQFAALALPGRRTVLTIHDCGFMRHPNPVARWLLKKLWLQWPVRHCRVVTAVSEATKSEIVRYCGCSPEKVVVIPSAIPGDFMAAPKPFNTAYPTVLHIGSAPNKNLQRHLLALAGVPCRLHMIGRLQAQEIALIQELNIDYQHDNELSAAELRQAYYQCDLLLFASTLEGFGMPILEAQSVGRPVVTSNCSSMPEIAGPGACLVDPLDVASIRAGVLQVIQNQEYRENLVRAGVENVRRFRPETIARQYLDLYRSIS